MLKTCSRCGIVPIDHICPYKPHKNYKEKDKTEANGFRKTYRWTNKAKEIRERDNNLCQICLKNKYNTVFKYNFKKLEVHHIVPLHEDYSKRLDNNNLITLCSFHHKMADNGLIPRDELISYIPPTR